METSDSECFESADEEIENEEETPVTRAPFTPCIKPNKKEEKPVNEKLQDKHPQDRKGTSKPKSQKKINKLGTPLGVKFTPAGNFDQHLNAETEKNAAVDEKKSSDRKTEELIKCVEKAVPAVRDEQVEENMWEDQDWEDFDTLQQNSKSSSASDNISNKEHHPQTEDVVNNESVTTESAFSWDSWSTWSVPSVLSTATQSVASITNHVSHGLNSVIESSMNIPDPEEMARLNISEKQLSREEISNTDNPTDEAPASVLSFKMDGFMSGVSQLTKLVESTGTRVISGGLDTLEIIGKKTMEVLQEGDPGLKKKRAFLKLNEDKPILSQLLREAREKHENETNSQSSNTRTKNYETYFDDFTGLVHLEALELLSKQCEIKLCTLMEMSSNETLTDIQETVEQVRELCELPEDEENAEDSMSDLKASLSAAVDEMKLTISYEKLLNRWDEFTNLMKHENNAQYDESKLYEMSIESLAELTAMAVEQFHKIGELLLIKEHRSTADEADCLVRITIMLSSLVNEVAVKFSENLSRRTPNSLSKEELNSLITNVFFEAANSSSYIKDAFKLLIPVLQVGAV